MNRMTRPYAPAGAGLFHEPDPPKNIYIANVDGASRGNPGPASYAVIIRGPDGKIAFQVGKYLGRATNNVAEYYALITALDYAAAQGIERLLVRSDSELLVRQMQGRYKVKSPDLRPLFERAHKLSRGFAHFAIEHVRRELNSDADELANIALDKTSTVGGLPAVSQQAPPPRLPEPGAKPPERGNRAIRARFSAGALHPLAALDLSEGEIVEIDIRRADRV
jgi:probable phosphoglycerate mutase